MEESMKNHREKLENMVETEQMLSKYMNEKHNTNSWLLDTIKEILASEEIEMKDHGWKFENTKAAAKFNSNLLKKYNYNYETLVKDHPNSTITPGSEFRKPELLEKLFGKHSDCNFIKILLKEGADYPINKDIVDEKNYGKI